MNRRVAAAVLVAVLVGGTAGAEGPRQAATARDHVEYLASDELAGRMTGSEGARRAAAYLVEQLEALGARPLPGAGALTLPFEFTAGVTDVGSSVEAVAADGASLGRFDSEQFRALSFSDGGEVSGPVVFAGYGLSVPESQSYPYDNFATLDVQDKIVVVLRYIPVDVDQETRAILGRYSGLRYKAMKARELGAKALLVVTGPRSPNAGDLVEMSADAAAAGSGIIAASITADVAATLFSTLPDGDLEATQRQWDTGNPHVAGFEFPGLELSLSVKIERLRETGTNVVGYLPPSDATEPTPDKPFVVLGAHYDHLGLGRGGNSLARGEEVGAVHNGADDNASGVAAVLRAGAELAASQRRRGVVLAFWSGEELGTLGSVAFVQSGAIPAEQTAAYINFDMVGRVRDNIVTIQAVGSSEAWPGLIERTNVPIGFDVRTQDDPYLPTDSTAFNSAGIPSLSFFSGTHQEYHRPTDDAALINFEDLERVARFGALLARRVANLGDAPAFVAVAQSPEQAGSRDSARAFTGTIPDYTSEIEGLLLGGVIEGGPAAEAGLEGGDVIVEFAGQAITNIYDYTYALDAIKVDVPVTVVYVRDGERHETELIPRARQ